MCRRWTSPIPERRTPWPLARTSPLPRLHPKSGLPDFGIHGRPKSDKSDFGWRVREGAPLAHARVASPPPPPPPTPGARPDSPPPTPSPPRAGRHRRRELGIFDDRFLPGLTRLTGEIHRGGAKASIQLGHGGGHTRRDICGETPVAPSAIPHPVFEVTNETIVPKEMTLDDIRATIAAFAAAATRAQNAGFHCFEIHSAPGYLLSHFLPPFQT